MDICICGGWAAVETPAKYEAVVCIFLEPEGDGRGALLARPDMSTGTESANREGCKYEVVTVEVGAAGLGNDEVWFVDDRVEALDQEDTA